MMRCSCTRGWPIYAAAGGFAIWLATMPARDAEPRSETEARPAAHLQDGGQDAKPVKSPPERLLDDPQQGLDERIDGAKITESDPPPLPNLVVLPMPPLFEIAESAEQVPMDAELYAKAREAIDRGRAFLLSRQGGNGAWLKDAEAAPTDEPEKLSPVSAAVTGLVVKALVQSDRDLVNSDAVRRAMGSIMTIQNEDGSFEGGALTNYVTSTVSSALASLESADYYDDLRKSVTWLTTSQWDQGEGLSARQDWFGGAGYGGHGRPDMSNTQMMLDALYDAHMSPSEPAVQKALAFASRAQNLKQTNDAEWAGNDGGFIYTPANGGESKASEYAGEGVHGELIEEGAARSLRSYGSMTYAGFKSLLFAGLSQNDIRVRAAYDWIRNHWTFDENPGVGQQGLYYYYHAMARALRVAQQHVITDEEGVEHNWRDELVQALLERQREDGSWINEADRWMEGEPDLVTAYALLALEEALKPAFTMEEE